MIAGACGPTVREIAVRTFGIGSTYMYTVDVQGLTVVFKDSCSLPSTVGGRDFVP